MLIKQIVSIILNDLSREPRVLHLDTFAETINERKLIDDIITILFTCFKKEVSKLELVNLSNVWMTETSLDFLVNLKKLETNYEAQCKHFFENKVGINSYQEIKKFLLLADRLPKSFTINILQKFFDYLMQNSFPYFTDEDLKNIIEFTKTHFLASEASEIFNRAYNSCFDVSPTVIANPEYAQWLSKVSDIPASFKTSSIHRLYLRLVRENLRKTDNFSINEKLAEEFKISAYSLSKFKEKLFFERTIENYTAYLISIIEKNQLSEKDNSRLIEAICKSWSVKGLEYTNYQLLTLLLSRNFLHVIPKDPCNSWSHEVSLIDLANKYGVEPIISYFKKSEISSNDAYSL
jgi:hypothetical protein